MIGAVGALALADTFGWSDTELTTMKSLWISSLPPLPIDPSNRVANDPRAVKLGHALFFETQLSVDGGIACASCHRPDLGFADNNVLAEGEGTATRNVPSIVGAAYNRLQYWDGRVDSLWAQALSPLETAKEHGTNRLHVLNVIATRYRLQYEAIFGPLPATILEQQPLEAMESSSVQTVWQGYTAAQQLEINTAFANVGKAIAAYETQLKPGSSRFDVYASTIFDNGDPNGLLTLTPIETAGLALFMGKAGCVGCHSGARLTDDGFHNTGMPVNTDLTLPDEGRAAGLTRWFDSDFNCLSSFNDNPNRCAPFDFARVKELRVEGVGAFKTPSLRNLNQTAPYMHAGQFATLKQVVSHYNSAPSALNGSSELKPLGLTEPEVNQLVAFLETLKSATSAPLELLSAPR